MKKILVFLLSLSLLFSFCVTVNADDTSNTETAANADTNNTIAIAGGYLVLSLLIAGASAVWYRKYSTTKNMAGLIGEIRDSDAALQDGIVKLRLQVEALAEDSSVANNENFLLLAKEMSAFEEQVCENTTRHSKLCKIYSQAYDIEESTSARIKPIKISGHTLIPYKTRADYENIVKEYAGMPCFQYDNTTPLCGFVMINKQNQYVGNFYFEKASHRDVVQLHYDTKQEVSYETLCKTIRRLSEYCFMSVGGAYFFFTLEEKNETAKMVKKYAFTKKDNENVYYIDLNAENDIISVISAIL